MRLISGCEEEAAMAHRIRPLTAATAAAALLVLLAAQYLAHYPFGLVFVNKLSLTTISTG